MKEVRISDWREALVKLGGFVTSRLEFQPGKYSRLGPKIGDEYIQKKLPTMVSKMIGC